MHFAVEKRPSGSTTLKACVDASDGTPQMRGKLFRKSFSDLMQDVVNSGPSDHFERHILEVENLEDGVYCFDDDEVSVEQLRLMGIDLKKHVIQNNVSFYGRTGDFIRFDARELDPFPGVERDAKPRTIRFDAVKRLLTSKLLATALHNKLEKLKQSSFNEVIDDDGIAYLECASESQIG